MLTILKPERLVLVTLLVMLIPTSQAWAHPKRATFTIEEATITDIQKAIFEGKITATDLVEMYLERIKAYNGTCVNQPNGILGAISTIPHAGKLNALMTLNL